MMHTLTPSYGKDYKSGGEAVMAYIKGADFVLNCIGHRHDGAYCSMREMNGLAVKLRYNKLQDCIIFDPKGKVSDTPEDYLVCEHIGVPDDE